MESAMKNANTAAPRAVLGNFLPAPIGVRRVLYIGCDCYLRVCKDRLLGKEPEEGLGNLPGYIAHRILILQTQLVPSPWNLHQQVPSPNKPQGSEHFLR